MLSVSERPCQWPRHCHDFLERKRSIANARCKFVLVAVHCNALSQQTWDLTKPCNATKNWTSTVSDKRNTASAFAFATATHVSHIAPSQRPQAGRRSPRTRAPPDPRLSSPRFRIDRNRQRRSHANWLSWPHAQPVIDKDDVLAAVPPLLPPLYLPMHQQDIINTILYCVCNIGDNVHECTPCLEGYRGMSLHSTLCARCYNEVRSSFSLVRALTDTHMPTVHRTANITTTPQTTPTLARHARTPRRHRRHHSD